MSTIANVLKNIPSFSDFKIPELQKISDTFTLRHYDSGEVFIKEGEKSNSFYILLEGVVAVLRSQADTQKNTVLEKLSKGSLIGLVSILDQGPQTVSYRADEDITVAECSIADYQRLCNAADPIYCKFQFAIAVQLANEMRDCT